MADAAHHDNPASPPSTADPEENGHDAPLNGAERDRSSAAARRLHPMTLLHRFLVSLPALLLLLAPLLLRSPDENVWITLFFAVVYGIVAIPLIVLQYLRFKYWITPEEIVIQSGVFNRNNRSIPIERVQNIQVTQSLLPRLFGTAKVSIETAGSSATEGSMEFVGLEEADRIREVVRTYQRRQQAAPEAGTPDSGDPSVSAPASSATTARAAAGEDAIDRQLLFRMPLGRVLLSGLFRFSLLYIAVIFSILQYIPDFEEMIIEWFERGQLQWLADLAAASPWTFALVSIILAALFSWITGALLNLNRYYDFELWREGDKLYRRHGLITLSEGNIPLEKVQALILRSNPLMRRFGWYRLELQTMGVDVNEQGHQIAVPFAQRDEIEALAQHIYSFELPASFSSVSRLTIRRAFIRLSVIWTMIVAGVAYFLWSPAWWGLVAIPLLLYYAFLRYYHHGYALGEEVFFVRGGVFRHHIWVLPTEKHQVFYTTASLFQRRLGLKSLQIDTAGAGGAAYPEVFDLPAETANRLLEELYQRFRAYFENSNERADENS